MRRVLAATAIISISLLALAAQSVSIQNQSWTMEFPLERGELASTGRNPYFILEPGYTLVLEDKADQLIITVLDETKKIDGVETRVVEERDPRGSTGRSIQKLLRYQQAYEQRLLLRRRGRYVQEWQGRQS